MLVDGDLVERAAVVLVRRNAERAVHLARTGAWQNMELGYLVPLVRCAMITVLRTFT
jgi:hypothetical protein